MQKFRSASRLSWASDYVANMIYIALSAKTPNHKGSAMIKSFWFLYVAWVPNCQVTRWNHTGQIGDYYIIMCYLLLVLERDMLFMINYSPHRIIRFDRYLNRLILIYFIFCQRLCLFFGDISWAKGWSQERTVVSRKDWFQFSLTL